MIAKVGWLPMNEEGRH